MIATAFAALYVLAITAGAAAIVGFGVAAVYCGLTLIERLGVRS